ncbi:carboxyl-terminal processing protease [Hymenobacter luteus]|uniref:Carboxyl-terminal processing protease n=2 Tax=Hymenobacter TaxID=89966 RepID=A0A7W9WAM4_9BACT|nr:MULTISPECIES: S41 family peptidase [Hymenobacter]MBB4599587.1 carboxyl-terminal processing protease [Hymenobacter latericoloratus]MBB6058103.1 carboxyl-terminal processing protease [Hymenobacter luteus]
MNIEPTDSPRPALEHAPKNSRSKARQPFLLALALACGVLLGANPFRPSDQNPDLTARGYLKFKEILSYVDRDYVDSVNAEELSDYAISRMLERLDPHSVFIPAKQQQQASSFLQSDYDGIGVEFNLFRDTVTVVAPLSDGPAERAGLQPGDRILAVNGQRVSGVHTTTEQMFGKLRGPRGSAVLLQVLRRGQPRPLNVQVTRNRIPNSSVDVAYMVDNQTGYIKVSRFASGTYDEFKSALGDLRRQGLARLVLDLRGNPGGYLDRATKMADEFIGGTKKIVYTDGKGDQYDTQTFSRVVGEFEEGALVVLVDEGSASAAEVLAGALQDHDRALLVGRRTFGKGLVQQPIALNDGSELRLTIARYYTPSGRSIQKSYRGGLAQYEQDLQNRQRHGEFFHADSIHFADSLRYRTAHGRTVYGGGGIMPDLFVPRDTTAHSAYYTRLQSLNLVREYALTYYQEHKAELEGLRFEHFNQSFRITDVQLQQLAAKAARDGVPQNAADLRRSAALLRNQLKALIARSAYGKSAYYQVLNQEDLEMQQALRAVQEPSTTAMLGLLGK